MPRLRLVAVGVAAALLGCAATAPAGLAQAIPGSAPPGAGAAFSRVDTLTLAGALALALKRSPDLAVFAFETRAREAIALQAGRRPNPTLSLETENLGAPSDGASGADQGQTTLALGQLVELGGKRAARVRLAEAERALLAFDYETARLDLLARTAARFAAALAAQERARLTGAVAAIAEEGLGTTTQQVALGDRSPIEQTRAAVALASARAEAARAERTREAAVRALAALWGEAATPPVVLAGHLEALPPLPDFDALTGRLDDSPDLARWTAEVARRDAALRSERTRATPDLTFSAGYRQFHDGGGAAVLGASVPLPLFDRNGAGTRAAQERLAAADVEREAARNRLVGRLAEAYGELAAAHDEARLLGEVAVPGAFDAFQAVSEGYRLGRFAYLDVLDAQRTYVGAQGRMLDALAAAWAAAAEVERLTGAPLQPHSHQATTDTYPPDAPAPGTPAPTDFPTPNR